MKKIFVSDCTLYELSMTGRNTMLFREKAAVAKAADEYGVDSVELAPITSPREDAVIYKTIAGIVKNACLCIPAGDTQESVAMAYECIQNAVKPCIQVILPVSTVNMEYSYHIKDAVMLDKISELCGYAHKLCDCVEFTACDATRADRAFLLSAVTAAVKNGASRITLCDDAGNALPSELAGLVSDIKASVDAQIYVNVKNDIGMAAASAIAAIQAGADGVKTSVGGSMLGTGEFGAAVASRGTSIGITTGLKLTELKSDIDALISRVGQETYKTATGSGAVFLDGDSTIADVSAAASGLGYTLSDEDNGRVHAALITVCERKSSVGAKELEAIIASSAMQVPSTFHLESFCTTCSNLVDSTAQVVLLRDGEKQSGVAAGDGPIDAAFRAIEQCIGYHYELDDFQIQSVTGGKEALGSALVRLRSNGRLYSGNGLSADIVGASIRAYINALNKIVYEEDIR